MALETRHAPRPRSHPLQLRAKGDECRISHEDTRPPAPSNGLAPADQIGGGQRRGTRTKCRQGPHAQDRASFQAPQVRLRANGPRSARVSPEILRPEAARQREGRRLSLPLPGRHGKLLSTQAHFHVLKNLYFSMVLTNTYLKNRKPETACGQIQEQKPNSEMVRLSGVFPEKGLRS